MRLEDVHNAPGLRGAATANPLSSASVAPSQDPSMDPLVHRGRTQIRLVQVLRRIYYTLMRLLVFFIHSGAKLLGLHGL